MFFYCYFTISENWTRHMGLTFLTALDGLKFCLETIVIANKLLVNHNIANITENKINLSIVLVRSLH